jgi:hypothetical protein
MKQFKITLVAASLALSSQVCTADTVSLYAVNQTTPGHAQGECVGGAGIGPGPRHGILPLKFDVAIPGGRYTLTVVGVAKVPAVGGNQNASVGTRLIGFDALGAFTFSNAGATWRFGDSGAKHIGTATFDPQGLTQNMLSHTNFYVEYGFIDQIFVDGRGGALIPDISRATFCSVRTVLKETAR